MALKRNATLRKKSESVDEPVMSVRSIASCASPQARMGTSTGASMGAKKSFLDCRAALLLAMAIILPSLGLSACGFKGDLKTPSQIEAEEKEKQEK